MASVSFNTVPEIKVVLCGDKGVGKTAIYHRLEDDQFFDEESKTEASDQCTFTVPCGKNSKVKINLWDTAGMESFQSYTRSYFTKCHAVIFVYSADVKDSLSTALKCVKIAKDNTAGAKLILV